MSTPLEDPTYEPLHPPVRGVPDKTVKKWGPRSQLRWFQRFWNELNWRSFPWREYYLSSTQHTGNCCESCLQDYEEGYDWPEGGRCCCRSEKERDDSY